MARLNWIDKVTPLNANNLNHLEENDIQNSADISAVSQALVSAKADLEGKISKKSDSTHTHTGYANASHNHSYNDLTNKPTIPTTTSQLTNNSKFTDETWVINKIEEASLGGGGSAPDLSGYVTTVQHTNDLNRKVDVVAGKGLSTNDYTTTDKNKLAGLSNYIHPTTHPASIITQDSSNRFITDAERIAWNNKSNFDGNYNSLSNKPSIPVVSNDLTNTLKSNYDSAYTHSNSTHAPSNAQRNADITKAEIEAKLTGAISTHTHNYASTSHTHSEYSSSSHTHSNYSTTSHTHSNYASSNHTHEDTVVTKTVIGGALSLSADKYQTCSNLPSGTEINLPTVSGFAEINFRFTATSNVALVLPVAKYQSDFTFKTGNMYDLIFETYDGRNWTGGCVEYV